MTPEEMLLAGGVSLGERLWVVFDRTLRLREDARVHALTPSFGSFPVRRVRDFARAVPPDWDADGVFLPLYPQEALFLRFVGAEWKPNAVQVVVGGVNAVSGEPWSETLKEEPQNYLVCPPQPWLDGINAGEEWVRQFVAMPLGEHVTIEAQITGQEKEGGLRLLAYEPRPGRFPDEPPPEQDREDEETVGLESVAARPPGAMGLAAGGKMRQKIYPDPHGLSTWETDPAVSLRVYLVDSRVWPRLTGEEAPPSPIDQASYDRYGFPYYTLDDEEEGDVAPAPSLSAVKSVGEIAAAKSGAPPPEADAPDAPQPPIRKLPRPRRAREKDAPEGH